MSDNMLSSAKAGEWDNVIAQESARRDLIQDFFATKATVEEAQWVASGVRRIMDVDKEIMCMGKNDMRLIAAELDSLHRGKQVSNAYQKYA
jgi:hypothetical protein